MRAYTLLATASNTRQEQLGYAVKAQSCGISLLQSGITSSEDNSNAAGQFEGYWRQKPLFWNCVSAPLLSFVATCPAVQSSVVALRVALAMGHDMHSMSSSCSKHQGWSAHVSCLDPLGTAQ